MINKQAFERMKDEVVIVNVGVYFGDLTRWTGLADIC